MEKDPFDTFRANLKRRIADVDTAADALKVAWAEQDPKLLLQVAERLDELADSLRGIAEKALTETGQ